MRVSISSLGGHLKTGQRALPRTRTSPTFPSVWGLDQKMRLGCHQINDQTGGRPLALPKTTEMAWKVATLRVCLGIPGFDRMRSRRRIEENPGCFSNRGLFMGGPDQRSSNKQEPSWHDRRRLSSVASRKQCRRPVPPSFTRSFVTWLSAAGCFISAATVIAAKVIAAPAAGRKLAASSAAEPIAAINKPPGAVTIIATANVSTAAA